MTECVNHVLVLETLVEKKSCRDGAIVDFSRGLNNHREFMSRVTAVGVSAAFSARDADTLAAPKPVAKSLRWRKQAEVKTDTVGIGVLPFFFTQDWGVTSAGAVMSMLPLVIVFIFLQRYFIAGSIAGALKE